MTKKMERKFEIFLKMHIFLINKDKYRYLDDNTQQCASKTV